MTFRATIGALALGAFVCGAYAQPVPYPTLSEQVQGGHWTAVSRIGPVPLDPADPLDAMVLREARQIDVFAGFRTPVYWSDATPTSAHPSIGTILQRSKLAELSEGAEFVPELVAFILAHEKAHHLQFRVYGPGAFAAGCDHVRTLEAQADILAGHYMQDRMYRRFLAENDLSSRDFTRLLAGSVMDTDSEALRLTMQPLDVAFQIGESSYSFATHPSRLSRQRAVRMGIVAGLADVFGEVLGGDGDDVELHGVEGVEDGTTVGEALSDPGLRRLIVENMNQLNAALARAPGEPLMRWTMRLARLLTQRDRSALVDIVQVDEAIVWDTTAAHPYVTYSWRYENRGDRAIAVDALPQVVMRPRRQPDAWGTRIEGLVDGRLHRFKIDPGASSTISGVLKWAGDDEVHPSVIAPTSFGGLMSASFVGSRTSSAPTCSRNASIARAQDSGSDFLHAAALADLLERSPAEGFLDLAGGPGETGQIVGYATHPSTFRLLGSDETYVAVPANPYLAPLIRTTYSRGRDTDFTSAAVERAMSVVERATPGWRWERTDRTHSEDDGSPYLLSSQFKRVEDTDRQRFVVVVRRDAYTDGHVVVDVTVRARPLAE